MYVKEITIVKCVNKTMSLVWGKSKITKPTQDVNSTFI